jgi:hypothetical protein
LPQPIAILRPLVGDEIDKLLKEKGILDVTYESLAVNAESINRRVRDMRMRAAIDQITRGIGQGEQQRQ